MTVGISENGILEKLFDQSESFKFNPTNERMDWNELKWIFKNIDIDEY